MPFAATGADWVNALSQEADSSRQQVRGRPGDLIGERAGLGAGLEKAFSIAWRKRVRFADPPKGLVSAEPSRGGRPEFDGRGRRLCSDPLPPGYYLIDQGSGG